MSSASLGERISPVEALVELARSAREDPLDVVLNTVAETVHRVAGYRSGVLNLYRPAWDDYEMAVLVDSNDDVDEMQGQTNPRADFDRLPEMADERLPGVFFVSDEAFWEGISNVIFSPGWEASGDPDAWGQFDGLFVLLHDADGELLGNLSIDEPISGRRPTDAGLRLLRAISSHAADALGNARRSRRGDEMARIQSTLLAASSTLAACASTSELLQPACETIVPRLGFERAAAYRRGEYPELLLSATGGWQSRELLSPTLSIGHVQTLLIPTTEHFGCWLLDAHQLFSVSPYDRERSRRNGRGAAAWRDCCPVVPIRDARRSLSGLIVVEDPIDHLLPTDGKRRALRLLVDQVSALQSGILTRERLQHLASHDPLTGVRNRRNLTQLLEAHDEVALLICDLDDFRRINDIHGHVVGDQVLVRFGQLLRELARQEDVTMRLRGEEFCVALPHTNRTGALGGSRTAADRDREADARSRLRWGHRVDWRCHHISWRAGCTRVARRRGPRAVCGQGRRTRSRLSRRRLTA